MVEVVAGSHAREGRRPARRNVGQVARHVATAGHVERHGDDPVRTVVHHHVLHGPTKVDDEVELVFHLLLGMAHLEDAARQAVAAQHVAAVGGLKLDAAASEKRNVLHDDLSAHAKLARQLATRDRPPGTAEERDDLCPAIFSAHAPQPSMDLRSR